MAATYRSNLTQKNRSPRWGRWVQIVIWIVLLLLFVPMFEVLAVRFFDPTYTPLMLIRSVQGRVHSGPKPQPRCQWVDLENVSPAFLKAVWQTEDARFFTHDGFDWVEVNHSMADAKRTGRPARGASTISMQCARSLFLWQGRSWIRKPLEAYYTILMETVLTKSRILELYVNVIETGDGLYGVEAAARYYWNSTAKTLTREQAARLVAMLPNPRERNPARPNPKTRMRIASVMRKLKASPALPPTIWRTSRRSKN